MLRPIVQIVSCGHEKYRVAISRLGTGHLVSIRKNPGLKPIPLMFCATNKELALYLDQNIKE